MFSVLVTQEARGTVLVLRGELDHDSAVQLHEARERAVGLGPGAGPVVVDCAALGFCDSSGIGVLVKLFHQLTVQGRELRIAAAPASVLRLFRVTGLDQVFTVHPDVDRALEAGTGGMTS